MYLDSGMGRVSFFQEALEKIYSKILTGLKFIMVKNVMTNYGRLCVKKKLERQRTAANENQKISHEIVTSDPRIRGCMVFFV